MSSLFIIVIKFYQVCVSPFKRNCCRYHPSCSEYARLSFEKHGAARSFFPVLKRVFSCHPFSKKPFWDPVN
tara:strand:- start:244 stop:456 length:213 start_codon:yes stop_codon:yes gene_type:complete